MEHTRHKGRKRFKATGLQHCQPSIKLFCSTLTHHLQSGASFKEQKEHVWGYGSGVAAATTPDYGDVVLAEFTQPFNATDVTSFRPLYQQALGRYPMHITADAAYDAWYVYEAAARHGGMAAVPLNQHSHAFYGRAADGTPRYAQGFLMQPTFHFDHTNGYRAHRFRCPLLCPEPTGATCDHQQFAKGKGCINDGNWELGGRKPRHLGPGWAALPRCLYPTHQLRTHQ